MKLYLLVSSVDIRLNSIEFLMLGIQCLEILHRKHYLTSKKYRTENIKQIA
jgi:hypothetical protein